MMYPKIGIRPVIDGRWGGIRESLEAQTMGMAHAAKALIETLKYPDGTPVQVVVSPCTIGGGAEAARCEEYFSAQNVTATLTVTPCCCTTSGRSGSALLTRFCSNTMAILTSVPSAKVTVRE